MTRRNRPTAPCSASSQDFENDAGKVPPVFDPQDVGITCPCCQYISSADQFAKAPSATRGPIVLALAKEGLTPRQIAEVTGWNYSTVRSALWYQKHVAKRKP